MSTSEASPAQARSTQAPVAADLVPTGLTLINPARPSAGVCITCFLPIDPIRTKCRACLNQPNHLDAIVPITYAPRGGPIYAALREYKNARLLQQGTCATIRVAGILWRFLESHERCIAAAAGTASFDLVTTVPSGTPDRDEHRANLRAIAAWCGPVADRYRGVLHPTRRGRWGRGYDPARYLATESTRVQGSRVLLIDDLWVTGGHAQSAAHALRAAGATTVALVTVGRYLRLDWPAGPTASCGEYLANDDRSFEWNSCAGERPNHRGSPVADPAKSLRSRRQ